MTPRAPRLPKLPTTIKEDNLEALTIRMSKAYATLFKRMAEVNNVSQRDLFKAMIDLARVEGEKIFNIIANKRETGTIK